MTKRPRLSTNLKVAAHRSAPATLVEEPAGAPAVQAPLIMPPSPVPRLPGPAAPFASAATDGVAAIFAETFMAISAAFFVGWSQSLILPYRVSAHLLKTGSAAFVLR